MGEIRHGLRCEWVELEAMQNSDRGAVSDFETRLLAQDAEHLVQFLIDFLLGCYRVRDLIAK